MKERRLTQKTTITINIIMLVTLILFLLGTTFGGAEWKTDLEHKVENNTNDIESIQDVQGELIEQIREQENSFIEIKTDLKWIRAKLEEY